MRHITVRSPSLPFTHRLRPPIVWMNLSNGIDPWKRVKLIFWLLFFNNWIYYILWTECFRRKLLNKQLFNVNLVRHASYTLFKMNEIAEFQLYEYMFVWIQTNYSLFMIIDQHLLLLTVYGKRQYIITYCDDTPPPPFHRSNMANLFFLLSGLHMCMVNSPFTLKLLRSLLLITSSITFFINCECKRWHIRHGNFHNLIYAWPHDAGQQIYISKF